MTREQAAEILNVSCAMTLRCGHPELGLLNGPVRNENGTVTYHNQPENVGTFTWDEAVDKILARSDPIRTIWGVV